MRALRFAKGEALGNDYLVVDAALPPDELADLIAERVEKVLNK